MESTQRKANKQRLKPYHIIGAFLGWLGAINSLLTGIFIVNTVFIWKLFLQAELILQGYAAGVATAFSSIALAFGSYLLWKGCMHRGGVINMVAGIVFTFIYLYFGFFSRPPLLGWLGLLGHFLIAPPLLSGVIGILATTDDRSQSNSQKQCLA